MAGDRREPQRTPGRIVSHRGFEIRPYLYSSNYPGTKTQITRVDTAPQVCKPQPHLLVVDWLGLMEPARGESCPWGQRRGRAAPGGETFPSPGQKYFHTCTTPTTRGQKRRSPGSMPPRRVWKPQPRWVIVDWLELMEPAHGEGCSSGQRRGPAAPGGDKFPSPDQKYFHICTTSTTWGRKRGSPGRCLPAGCERPNPSG